MIKVVVGHSDSNHKCRTHTHAWTQRQSCTSEGRRRSPTRHLCNRQRDDDRSLALYKMTTQVVKCCINYSTARRFRLQDQWPGWWLSVKNCSFHIFCKPCRISLASDPPSHPCQWSDSDHTGKSYVLGRHRESQSRPGTCDSRPGNAFFRELTSVFKTRFYGNWLSINLQMTLAISIISLVCKHTTKTKAQNANKIWYIHLQKNDWSCIQKHKQP